MSSVFAVLLVFEADAVEAEDLTELVFVELVLSAGLAPQAAILNTIEAPSAKANSFPHLFFIQSTPFFCSHIFI